MDDQELDRRLRALDPARPVPSSLDAVIDDVGRQAAVPSHSRKRAVAVVAGAVVVLGGLAAFTDLDTFLLSIPPFSTLDDGTVRTTGGLPYVPVGETDRGESCAMWVDFGGLTSEQFSAADAYWSDADPGTFADRVNARLGAVPSTDDAEVTAKREQLLEDFGRIVPGLAWGSAPPGNPWKPGEPHLTSFSTVCTDDPGSAE